ncbi:annexin B9-like [Venturia canescens]|uniref:annexin B9-like n=1 Tax=Venturia canescens TaxID=32260 RepID=UPI001C9D4EF1|nr:annexin B9-like [Venturia canescens]
MSYGYQGPPVGPFPGKQKPPTSFGAPPGTPSAPGALPYPNNSNIGFGNPPTSFGMPQPYAGFGGAPYPLQPQGSSPYPNVPGLNPCPYPNPNACSNPSLYPNPGGPNASPYPNPAAGPNSSFYPNPAASNPSMYPNVSDANPSPYTQQNSPYPGQNSSYPSSTHQPVPYGSQPTSCPAQTSPYPTQNPTSTSPYPPRAYPPQNHPLPFPSSQQPYPGAQSSATNPYYSGNPQAPPNPTSRPQSSPYPGSSQYSSHPANGNFPSANSFCSPGGVYPGGQGAGGRPFASSTGSHYAQPHKNSPAPRSAQLKSKLSPTVVPYPNFDPRVDAEVLRKAMKGFGTDDKALIEVLANRTNLQRQEIATQFKTLYGKDLVKDLKSETSGNFENLLVAMMTPLPQYYAKELHDAMSRIGTDENVLIEVLCTLSNHEIRVIKQAYQAMYGRSLEDDLMDDTSGNFKRLMVSLCCANRDESFEVDPDAVATDVRNLLQAGELRFGTDESVFNAVLVQRNIPQLQHIFQKYELETGHSFETAIENEFSGDIKKGLLAIVKCVKDRPAFFAEQLYKSMKGLGTDDARLIRLIVTRSEVDLGEIKRSFAQNQGESLESCISGDCSGSYKKCLLALAA